MICIFVFIFVLMVLLVCKVSVLSVNGEISLSGIVYILIMLFDYEDVFIYIVWLIDWVYCVEINKVVFFIGI